MGVLLALQGFEFGLPVLLLRTLAPERVQGGSAVDDWRRAILRVWYAEFVVNSEGLVDRGGEILGRDRRVEGIGGVFV